MALGTSAVLYEHILFQLDTRTGVFFENAITYVLYIVFIIILNSSLVS